MTPALAIQESTIPGAAEGELAELLRSFNDVTSKLQDTHETLRGEVARLEHELRDAHDQLRRARELAALGEMAAGIAHEIRNPLGSIRLYASVLEEDLADQAEPHATATKIGDCVRRLDSVVCDVLHFAREMRLVPEVCEAADLFDGALEASHDVIEHAGCEVVRADLVRAPLEFECDAARIHQALVNVIRNAAEAFEERSHAGERRIALDADVRDCLLADGSRRPMVVLSVADTGPGISEEAAGRIFNPFFTTRHTGTGLGLAIVHRIIDAHGGSVRVSSGDGGTGTTIDLLLPTAESGRRHEEEST